MKSLSFPTGHNIIYGIGKKYLLLGGAIYESAESFAVYIKNAACVTQV
jgi:hypothetical protein